MSNHTDAAIFFGGIFTILIGGVVFIACLVAPGINQPPTKSVQELCEERGGVYVQTYKSKTSCFNKDAFK